MRIFNRSVLIGVLLGSLCIICAPARCYALPQSKTSRAAASQPLYSFTIGAAQPIVPSGSPIIINIVIKNISTGELRFFFADVRDRAGRVYSVYVFGEKGDSPPDTKFGRILKYNLTGCANICPEILQGSGDALSLKPGEAFSDAIDITKLYDFSQPGKYTVQLGLSDQDNGIVMKSNTLTITVTPNQNISSSLAGSSVATPQPSFSLTIMSASGDSVKLGAPIGVKIVTTNKSNYNISLWTESSGREQAGATYEVTIRDINGMLAPATEYGRQMKNRADLPQNAGSATLPGGWEQLFLKRGESWIDTIIPDKLYEIKRPGEYTIQVQRFDPATKTMIESNPLVITVTP